MRGYLAQLDEQPKFRKGGAHQSSGGGGLEFGNQRRQHARVVTGLEARRKHQRAAAHQAQRKIDFRGSVGGIEIDERQTGACRGEQGEHPLGTIGRPDADALAGLEATGDHAARDPLHRSIEFSEREPQRLIRNHEGGALGALGGGGLEHAVDGAIEQGSVAGARLEARCGRHADWMHVLAGSLGP